MSESAAEEPDGTADAAARLEAALERIANAAQAAPRAGDAGAHEPRDAVAGVVATRLDALIDELRTALSSTEA